MSRIKRLARGSKSAAPGRAPRILFVGNVANNAYLIAKMLRAEGVDVDVLCNDYYHMMGCPEWEEQRLEEYGDDFAPSFVTKDSRPDWFVQGPGPACINYLLLRRRGFKAEAEAMAEKLARSIAEPDYREPLQVEAVEELDRRFDIVGMMNPLLFPAKWRDDLDALRGMYWKERAQLMLEEFSGLYRDLYPEWAAALEGDDFVNYCWQAEYFSALFQDYDIVQFFGGMTMWNAMCRPPRSIGYEHGTLRYLPEATTIVDRLTAVGYTLADQAYITNGDCLDCAPRLGITKYAPMLHPVDADQHRSAAGRDKPLLPREDGDVLLLCPLRHDWAVKGTDIHIRALPLIKARLPGRSVKLVLTEWGLELEASRALAKSLGVDADCVWIKPQSRRALVDMTNEADVVLDQIALPHFGATAPQAIAAGTPVISSYEPQSTTWLVAEPAPILPAFTPEDVAEQVCRALDPTWRDLWRNDAKGWFERCHHPKLITARHREDFDRLMRERPPESLPPMMKSHLQEARVVRSYGPEGVVCHEPWKEAGADLQAVEGGVRVVCAPRAGIYSASLLLDFSGIDFEHERCTVVVRFSDLEGQVLASLFDMDRDLITEEFALQERKFMPGMPLTAVDGAANMLLFHAGQTGREASVVFKGVDIMVGPHPTLAGQAAPAPARRDGGGDENGRLAEAAPIEGRRLQAYGPENVICGDFWRNAGADLQPVEGGVRVVCAPEPGFYSAAVIMDLAEVDFEHEEAWVSVQLDGLEGDVWISLFDPQTNRMVSELIIREDWRPRDHRRINLRLKASDSAANMLLFRGGQAESQASVVFRRAQVIVATPAADHPIFASAALANVS